LGWVSLENQTEKMLERPVAKQRLFVQTYGCQMNEYDSQKMTSLLKDDYLAASSVEEADLVLVNTCSVREKGEHKLFSYLGRLRDLKKEKPEMIIGVGGCVAQQEGQSIIDRNSSVDFVVGTHNISLIPALVKKAKIRDSVPQVAVDYREEWEELPLEFTPLASEYESVRSPNHASIRALVSIQRGCNKKCAFCVVPTTRGEELSRAADEILREIKLKVRAGAKEVLLLGQTVNSYGRDLTPRRKFSDLIKEIAEIDGLDRIRFISPHPQEVKEDFIELYRTVPKLAKHIHLPVQSGNDRVLKAMNRNYRISRYRDIVNQVRDASPDIAITTDVIIGFPTETESEFEETLSLVQDVRYHSAFFYKYSKRPNTVAGAQYSFEDEVTVDAMSDRFTKVHELQKKISLEIHRAEVGQHRDVLVEGIGSKEGFKDQAEVVRGRTSQNVIVDFLGNKSLVGQTVKVKITDSTPHLIRGLLV
jgi:tRNA-2-methylthio-N6-dimethylallyladenosine synthase